MICFPPDLSGNRLYNSRRGGLLPDAVKRVLCHGGEQHITLYMAVAHLSACSSSASVLGESSAFFHS